MGVGRKRGMTGPKRSKVLAAEPGLRAVTEKSALATALQNDSPPAPQILETDHDVSGGELRNGKLVGILSEAVYARLKLRGRERKQPPLSSKEN